MDVPPTDEILDVLDIRADGVYYLYSSRTVSASQLLNGHGEPRPLRRSPRFQKTLKVVTTFNENTLVDEAPSSRLRPTKRTTISPVTAGRSKQMNVGKKRPTFNNISKNSTTTSPAHYPTPQPPPVKRGRGRPRKHPPTTPRNLVKSGQKRAVSRPRGCLDSPVPTKKCRNPSMLLNQCSELPTSVHFVVTGTSPPYFTLRTPGGRTLVWKLLISPQLPEIQTVDCPRPPMNDAQLSSSPPPQTASQQARKSGFSIQGSSPPPPFTSGSTERTDHNGNKIPFCVLALSVRFWENGPR